jgi:SAM-dependent methyltransferase
VRFREERFRVLTCLDCDLTYVTPRLEPGALVAEVYDESYWTSPAARERGYSDYRADEALYLRTFEKRMRIVRRHFARPGRVLDVGCAAGYFLRVMRDEGWDVSGLEPSAPIRATAVASLGEERVLEGDLASAHLTPAAFDLVTLWDVLEHTPDPLDTLRRCARLLRPDGKLLIETQNVNSLAARLLGRRWHHYKHAEHLYHFHPGTLGRLLGKAGFAVLEDTRRCAGKFVSPAFIAERARKVAPVLGWAAAPLAVLPRRGIYVNLGDERIAIARLRD